MSGNSFRDLINNVKEGLIELHIGKITTPQLYQNLRDKLSHAIDAMTLYTLNGDLDYYDGLPASKSGIWIDVKSLANILDFNNLEASINDDLFKFARIFLQQRISEILSLGMSIDHPKDFFEANRKLKKIVKYNDQNIHELNDSYKLLSLNGYLGISYETSVKLEDFIKGIKDLVTTLKNISERIQDKMNQDISSINSDSDFFFFTLEHFKYLIAFLDCADKETYETILQKIKALFNLFEIQNIHCTNYASASYAFGGRLAVAFKVRLDFSIELGYIVEFDLDTDQAKAGDLIFNWLRELYLTITEKI